MNDSINNLEDLYLDVHKLNDSLNDYLELVGESAKSDEINKKLKDYRDINNSNSRTIENELLDQIKVLKEKKVKEEEKNNDEEEKDDIIK
jgi:hypothetical protein